MDDTIEQLEQLDKTNEQRTYNTEEDYKEGIALAKEKMEKAVKDGDFLTAAQYRDEMFDLKDKLAKHFGK